MKTFITVILVGAVVVLSLAVFLIGVQYLDLKLESDQLKQKIAEYQQPGVVDSPALSLQASSDAASGHEVRTTEPVAEKSSNGHTNQIEQPVQLADLGRLLGLVISRAPARKTSNEARPRELRGHSTAADSFNTIWGGGAAAM